MSQDADDLFLTKDQLKRLTGTRIRKAQIAWLRKQGMRFWVNLAGDPIVPRSEVGATVAPQNVAQAAPGAWEPAVLRQ